jgi:hypothetical protein
VPITEPHGRRHPARSDSTGKHGDEAVPGPAVAGSPDGWVRRGTPTCGRLVCQDRPAFGHVRAGAGADRRRRAHPACGPSHRAPLPRPRSHRRRSSAPARSPGPDGLASRIPRRVLSHRAGDPFGLLVGVCRGRGSGERGGGRTTSGGVVGERPLELPCPRIQCAGTAPRVACPGGTRSCRPRRRRAAAVTGQ